MSIVTLTTDFGTADHYVAAMKGVLLTLSPQTTIVDITHEIRPQDVVHGAFVFRQAFAYFPAGTVHVVVVDPGVGTSRRLLAMRYAGQTVLAPDNGVVSIVHQDFPVEALREITNERWCIPERSNTFHGRDILAPVAGHLAAGRPFDEVGPATDHLEVLNLSEATVTAEGALTGYVIHVDRFGNLITNIKRTDLEKLNAAGTEPGAGLPSNVHVWVGEVDIGPLKRTYGDGEEGTLLALVGSAELLEIAVNGGHAAHELHVQPGQVVLVKS